MSCARSLAPTIRSPVCPSSPFLLPARWLRTKPRAGPLARNPGSKSATPLDKASMRKIESMPFQTYQLALKLIRKDREKNLKEIRTEQLRIANALKQPGATPEDKRIKSMQKHLEWLRVQADINSPRIKYNFDRGFFNLSKPIYRFLMDRKWRTYKRPVLMQRVTQMNVVPDILPTIDPVVDVQVRFRGSDVQPGTVVNSLRCEKPPTVKVIPFTRENMLCTVAVIDPDVPDVGNDSFTYQLHWLVSNISISHLQTQAVGSTSRPSDTIAEYLPPHVQKGMPYHRYGMFIFRQPGRMDAKALVEGGIKRHGFNLRSFQGKHSLEPIGVFMWRVQWDENMKDVMIRNNFPGWDGMWVRKRT